VRYPLSVREKLRRRRTTAVVDTAAIEEAELTDSLTTVANDSVPDQSQQPDTATATADDAVDDAGNNDDVTQLNNAEMDEATAAVISDHGNSALRVHAVFTTAAVM